MLLFKYINKNEMKMEKKTKIMPELDLLTKDVSSFFVESDNDFQILFGLFSICNI